MINVKICTGTHCYIMGESDLFSFIDELSKSEASLVKVEGSTCLDLCKEYNSSAPYVLIDDEVISNANKEVILGRVKDLLDRMQND